MDFRDNLDIGNAAFIIVLQYDGYVVGGDREA